MYAIMNLFGFLLDDIVEENKLYDDADYFNIYPTKVASMRSMHIEAILDAILNSGSATILIGFPVKVLYATFAVYKGRFVKHNELIKDNLLIADQATIYTDDEKIEKSIQEKKVKTHT